jgi:hypothetical protein
MGFLSVSIGLIKPCSGELAQVVIPSPGDGGVGGDADAVARERWGEMRALRELRREMIARLQAQSQMVTSAEAAAAAHANQPEELAATRRAEAAVAAVSSDWAGAVQLLTEAIARCDTTTDDHAEEPCSRRLGLRLSCLGERAACYGATRNFAACLVRFPRRRPVPGPPLANQPCRLPQPADWLY